MLKSFIKLSCAEKSWVIRHVIIAKKVFNISNESINVTKSLLSDTTLDGDMSGGQLDAFRHAYWMSLITINFGEKKAISLGKAHEKGNYQYFKKNKKEEGILPDYESSQMDYLNNDVGIEIGKNNPNLSNDSLKEFIIEQIKNGKLYILKKNIRGQFVTCDGKEICDSCKIWIKNKCIIQSNYLKKGCQ